MNLHEVRESLPSPIPHLIEYGSKRLFIYWDEEIQALNAYIKNDPYYPKKPNETSEVYTRLVQACRLAVVYEGKPITFLFRPSAESSLHYWGLTKGSDVFGGWNSISHDHKGGMVFTKIFSL